MIWVCFESVLSVVCVLSDVMSVLSVLSVVSVLSDVMSIVSVLSDVNVFKALTHTQHPQSPFNPQKHSFTALPSSC